MLETSVSNLLTLRNLNLKNIPNTSILILTIWPYILDDLDGISFWGKMDTYEGSGYVVNMGKDKESTSEIIKNLTTNSWLDQHTRVIFFEISILNTDSNLFSHLVRAFEFPVYGGMFVWKETQTVQLYRYTGPTGLFCLIIEVVCLIFYIVVIGYEVKKYISTGWRRVIHISSLLQLGNILLTGFAFSMYIYRSLLTVSTIEKMVNNRGR